MAFFGNIKNSQPAAPVKKPRCIVHPENAPKTIPDRGYPEDFEHYDYAGATIEMVTSKRANGEVVRRPALVARMVKKYRTPEGAHIVEEMTASVKDLMTYKMGSHPNAVSIAAALVAFYANNVPENQHEVKQRSSAQIFTMPPIMINTLYEKLNDTSSRAM